MLPRLFDREGGFGLVRNMIGGDAELRTAAQGAVDEEAVDDRIRSQRLRRVFLDEVIGDRSSEAIGAACRIETQKMLAEAVGFTDPELPDHASCLGSVVHDV